MNPTTCAAITAYISAAVSKAHVDRDLYENVEQDEKYLVEADEYLSACFQALPEGLQAFLNESTY